MGTFVRYLHTVNYFQINKKKQQNLRVACHDTILEIPV